MVLTLTELNFFMNIMETEGFFQFEIIINAFVRSFWFIWIPVRVKEWYEPLSKVTDTIFQYQGDDMAMLSLSWWLEPLSL